MYGKSSAISDFEVSWKAGAAHNPRCGLHFEGTLEQSRRVISLCLIICGILNVALGLMAKKAGRRTIKYKDPCQDRQTISINSDSHTHCITATSLQATSNNGVPTFPAAFVSSSSLCLWFDTSTMAVAVNLSGDDRSICSHGWLYDCFLQSRWELWRFMARHHQPPRLHPGHGFYGGWSWQ